MLAMVTAQSIGLLLGASVQQFEKAQVLATVVILTLMLVGGFFARHIPAALFWLKYVPLTPLLFSVQSSMCACSTLQQGVSILSQHSFTRDMSISIRWARLCSSM